jgi:hypothetical protein
MADLPGQLRVKQNHKIMIKVPFPSGDLRAEETDRIVRNRGAIQLRPSLLGASMNSVYGSDGRAAAFVTDIAGTPFHFTRMAS